MFPGLLYVGDVPVESTYHGSALLHRLLASYPTEKLTIIETGTTASQPARRLPNVRYVSYPIGEQRWLNTRFHPQAVVWYSHRGKQVASTGCRPLYRIAPSAYSDPVLRSPYVVLCVERDRLAQREEAQTLREAGTGIIARLDSRVEIENALIQTVSEIRKGTWRRASNTAIARYSRESQAGQLADLLDSVTASAT